MKFFSVLLISCVFIFTSCEKEEDIIAKTYFTYTIDGTNYRQEMETPVIQDFSEGSLMIQCNHMESGSGFYMIADAFDKTTGSFEAPFAQFTGPDNGIFANGYSGTGTVEVTNISRGGKYVEGTFTYLDEDEAIIVTNGAFLLRYEN